MGEGPVRQEAHVLGEHGEQAAHQEAGDGFGSSRSSRRRRACGRILQGAGQSRQPLGDLARHAGAAPRWVQAHRVEPESAQELARVVVQQVGQVEPVMQRVGERDVVPAGAGELGVERDGTAHVDDDQEGRPAVADFVGRQVAGVALGLLPRTFHGRVPGRGAAHRSAPFARLQPALGFLRKRRPRLGPVAALLGLQHEAAAAIEVDALRCTMRQRHGFLEDIGVVGPVGCGGVRARDVEEVAQLRKEELVVGALGRAGGLPACDEGVNG